MVFFPKELSQRRCSARIHHREEPGLVTILIDSDVNELGCVLMIEMFR